MKGRWRKRRVVKWLATGMLVLLLVGWGVSLNYSVGYTNKRLDASVQLSGGGLYIIYVPKSSTYVSKSRPAASSRFYVNRFQGIQGWSWSLSRPFVINRNNFSAVIMVSLWSLFLVGFVGTAFLWRWDRPLPLPGHCQSCGYNLTGNTSGVCPECGEGI